MSLKKNESFLEKKKIFSQSKRTLYRYCECQFDEKDYKKHEYKRKVSLLMSYRKDDSNLYNCIPETYTSIV